MTTDGGKEGTFKKTNNDNGVFFYFWTNCHFIINGM